MEERQLLSTLVLPSTSAPPTFVATYPINEAGTIVEGDEPLSGGNFLGTLNGSALKATYCVEIDLYIEPGTTYSNAAVTNNGTVYSAAVPNAGAVSWLIQNIGPTATTPEEQDALQAAIWRAEYGSEFQLDGVDNDNGAPSFNSTIGPIYQNDLAALGNHTAPVANVDWISPGPNPDTTEGQGLVALGNAPSTQTNTTTTVTSSVNPSTPGQSVTFTATVADTGPGGAGTPTGSVQFKIDGSNYGSSVVLASGHASVSDAALSTGSHTVQAVYTPNSSSFTGSTSAAIHQTVSSPSAASARLQSIDFTSAQSQNGTTDVFYQNTTSLGFQAGVNQAYPVTQWQVNPTSGHVTVNAPFAQPENTHVTAAVRISVPGVPSGTPYHLVGTSSEPALRFNQSGNLALDPSHTATINVTGQSSLGGKVRIIDQPITWTLILNPGTAKQHSIALGQTGPHMIYVTVGRSVNDNLAHPFNVVTDQRMQLAVEWTAAAIAATGSTSPSPPRIVYEMSQLVTQKVGFNPYYDLSSKGGNYWLAAGNPSQPNNPSQHPALDCDSISTFVSWVCQMVGLPGTITTMTFVPNILSLPPSSLAPNQHFAPYATAVWGSLQPFSPIPAGANPANFRYYLSSNGRMQLDLWDSHGIANAFEAATVLTWAGHTYYFPGGSNKDYVDNANKVLTVFASLGWGVWEGNKEIEVKPLCFYKAAPSDPLPA
jgi:hypothetical protein